MIPALATVNFFAAAAPVAEGGTSPLSFNDLTSVFSKITDQFSATTILGVIAGLVAICITFAFLWWGVRKGISKIMSAVKKGKVSP